MRKHPPRIGKRILKWFVHAEFVEEVEGDLDEVFYERLNRQSLLVAKFFYLVDVLHSIRPYRQFRTSTTMLHEIMNVVFLRLALRNLSRRKVFATTNILSLGIGLASFMLIMQYVAFERSYDLFHERADRIYRVAFDWGETDYNGENSSVYASSVPGMGPAIMDQVAEVESFTRFVPVLTVKPHCIFSISHNNELRYTANEDRGFFADPAFLEIFSFRILQGNSHPLDEPNSIVITRSFAGKIFGNLSDDQIVGSAILVDNGGKEDHIVTAILEDVPSNSHIQFDYLISYATINSPRLEDNLGWSQFYTYILSTRTLSHEFMTPKFEQLTKKLYGNDTHISIFLQPLKDIHLLSKLREELQESGSVLHLAFLTIIAFMILFMTWINYVNMFLAVAMERVNEISIKKVLGSTRIHLVVQFFSESVLITVVAFIFAAGLFFIIQEPFGHWLGKDITSVIADGFSHLVVIFSGVMVGNIIAGLYPAIVLSSYYSSRVPGGKLQKSGDGLFFKKSLVYFQFIVSFIIVSCTFIIDRQVRFMKSADLGMELSGCVAIRSPGDRDDSYSERLRLFKDRMLTRPFVKDVSFTSSIPGKPIRTSTGVQRVVGPELEGNNIFYLNVDENFINTYNIRLIAGANFKKDTDIPSVILNEAALKTLKFDSPSDALNHRIHWQRKEFEVIGVIANYNHLFLKEMFEPVMLTYKSAAQGFISMKVRDGFNESVLADARKELDTLFPGGPFEYTFLETAYDHQYRSIAQFESLAKYFALLAILIACFGLFSLSYYNVKRRTREMAVRKVLGASVINVTMLLARGYLVIACVSCLLGSLITWYAMNEWLQNFAFAIHLNKADFLIPMAAITSFVMVTISYSCIRTSLINPSTTLKQS